MKHFWWMILLPVISFAGVEGDEKRFSEDLKKVCELNVKVDLHDYSYGRDEERRYSNLDFEPASNLVHIMKGACSANPDNKTRLERINALIIKRGNFGERKLIMKKNGEMIFLAGRDPKVDTQDWLKAELTKFFSFDYESPEKKKEKVEAANKEVATKKSDEDRAAKQAEKEKKIGELTMWFQAEVKKLTANPTDPDMSKKLEALSNTYKEKLNALTTP